MMVVASLKLLAFYASSDPKEFLEINYTYEKAAYVLMRFLKQVKHRTASWNFTCPHCTCYINPL